MCDKLNFSGVTQTVWDCVVSAIQADYGIAITGDSGTVTKGDDWTFVYGWDGRDNASIQCTNSPWWAPCSTINGTITNMVTGCGGVATG